MNYKLSLLILFISIFSHSTNITFLTDNEQSYFLNYNNIKIINRMFSPKDLSKEIPTFYGIYRIGADLVQKTIKNKTHNNKFVLGVIDGNFDIEKNFIKNKIQNSLPFCEIIEKRKDETQEHGTHVVGTICGENYGVAYNCNFSLCLALGNGYVFKDDSCHNKYFKSILSYYQKNNVKIVSRSMGSKKILRSFDEEDTIKQIIKFTNKTNAIFVNAAGNDNAQIFDIDEGSLEQNNVLVVSNIDFLNFKNESSNFGDLIFIAAPGTNIFSSTTKKNEQNYESIHYDNSKDNGEKRLIKLTGTSMATPHVSGTIAAMIDVNRSEEHTSELQSH